MYWMSHRLDFVLHSYLLIKFIRMPIRDTRKGRRYLYNGNVA